MNRVVAIFLFVFLENVCAHTMFVGIFTTSLRVTQRSAHRLIFTKSPLPPTIAHRFVICNQPQTQVDLQHEIDKYGDIFVLNCTENIDLGKTYMYFSTVIRAFPSFAHYMKADDDTYIHYLNLGKRLATIPLEHAYFGRTQYGLNGVLFNQGMAYALSADLVTLISTNEYISKNTHGFEDQLTAQWLRYLDKTKNYSFQYIECNEREYYEHPLAKARWSHDLGFPTQTIAIHLLKTPSMLLTTARFFF